MLSNSISFVGVLTSTNAATDRAHFSNGDLPITRSAKSFELRQNRRQRGDVAVAEQGATFFKKRVDCF